MPRIILKTRSRGTHAHSVFVSICLGITPWLFFAAIVAAWAIALSDEIRAPALPFAQVAAPSSSESPFSLSALHQRLPQAGLERVQKHIRLFQTRKRNQIKSGLARSTRYMAYYENIFQRRGMPGELAYLPLVESGFVEHAVSPAQAVGIWQFIPSTGQIYNLELTEWADARRDPLRSANAAAEYLKHLYRRFGAWELALAAYNAGANTVRWRQRENERAGLPLDFWHLKVPNETHEYVPAFIAAVLIAMNPSAYGFRPEEIRFQPHMAFDLLQVVPNADLDHLAEGFNLPPSALIDLNPHLIRHRTPPGENPHNLRVPRGTRSRVVQHVQAESMNEKGWMLHPVRRGDTVNRLAERFGVSAKRILLLNRLQDKNSLGTRLLLIIPLASAEGTGA